MMNLFDLMPVPSELPASAVSCLLGILGDEERARWEKMGHSRRRVEYLLGHALLRLRLSQLLEVPVSEVPLCFEKGEKPYLTDSPYFVSLSHCDGWLALAVACFPVGVDVEPVRERQFFGDLVKKSFAPEECAFFETAAPDAALKRFTELWTLREAFFKASGRPLWSKDYSFEIEGESIQLSFPGSPLSFPAAFSGESTIPWNFRLFSPIPERIIALAAKGDLKTAMPIPLEAEEMISWIERKERKQRKEMQ
ncbi:MAG: 4'-phosphopantetheinyl transferase superfamily protein [Deltaproteobacteria bacterium]|nr:4'-phosphopantetheinyl transferase superfamily protein [Deltaproteobacteria bacterium]